MKRLIKRILKAGWRGTFPLRRPFTRRLDAYFARVLNARQADETVVVLDHVIRELIRLQDRVERLQDSLDDRDRLTLVGDRREAS